jgi:hypothetical protein
MSKFDPTYDYGLSHETMTVLRNVQWFYANKRDDDDGIYVEGNVFMRGDGGFELRCLAEEGLTPATTPRLLFSTWLRDQTYRQDAVGALARDYVLGVSVGRYLPSIRTAESFRALLDRPWRPARWTTALDRAKSEWKASGVKARKQTQARS